MPKKSYEFLETIYQLVGESTLPFTEYLDIFLEKMKVPVYELLCIYGALLEKNYIRTSRQDRIYITLKGLTKLKKDFA